MTTSKQMSETDGVDRAVTFVSELLFPLKLTGSMNSREHWRARAKRVAMERKTVATACLLAPQVVRDANIERLMGHCKLRVTMTRISPRPTDSDNRVARLKGVRDELAVQLGLPTKSVSKSGVVTAEDEHPSIEWVTAWERGKPDAVRVRFEVVE